MKYICNSCGSESLRWSGKCSSCGEWGTLEEIEDTTVTTENGIKSTKANYKSITKYSKKTSSKSSLKDRIDTKFKELNRVLGVELFLGK